MVTVQNAAGASRSLQFIAADGARRFLHDGEITGNFCPLGFPAKSKAQQAVLVCEGLATGLTLTRPPGCPWRAPSAATTLAPLPRRSEIGGPPPKS